MIGVTTSAISEAEDIDDWFKINALYLVLCFMIVCVLLMVVPLLGYQAFLISTNQDLSDSRSPFDRGILQNWWVFLSNGDSNKWVHESVPNPMTSYDDDASSLVTDQHAGPQFGTMFLITWIYAPIAEAKRLAQETDPAQEATFLDPQDDKKR
uniref:Uncharacterized protein n=1 Tax=Hyaloperonospora arabidopsidis (strain Emoy2) TaxID=559515 RepID=M4BGL1_HYAAE